MSFVLAAIGGSAVLGLGGAALGASAAGNAADKQSAAADRASQLQYQMFLQQQANQTPWLQAGTSALYGQGGLFRKTSIGPTLTDLTKNLDSAKQTWVNEKLSQGMGAINDKFKNSTSGGGYAASLLNKAKDKMVSDLKAQVENEWNTTGKDQYLANNQSSAMQDQYELDPELTRKFTSDDFVKDPGYEFRMAEGQKALERSAAARGGLQSGGTLKALTQYGQDFASNEYQNAYNRFNNDQSNRFNRLSSIAGLGQTANSQMGAAGQNYANQVGQNYMGAANAQGAAGIASANAWGGALSGIGQAGMNGLAISQIGKTSTQPTWMDQNLSSLSTGGYSGGRSYGLFGRNS